MDRWGGVISGKGGLQVVGDLITTHPTAVEPPVQVAALDEADRQHPDCAPLVLQVPVECGGKGVIESTHTREVVVG